MNKIIKKRYILTVIIAVIIIYLTVAIVKTKGPVIRIETSVPASDFVVECVWAGGLFTLHGGGGKVSDRIAIINSNEEFDCGYSFLAGVYHATSFVMIRHPLYSDMQGEAVNGVRVVKARTKLDVLADKILNFELSVHGDDVSHAIRVSYIRSLPECKIDDLYLDYYRKINDLDINYFKRLYNQPLLECYTRRIEEIKKYGPNRFNKLSKVKVEDIMKELWGSDRWE